MLDTLRDQETIIQETVYQMNVVSILGCHVPSNAPPMSKEITELLFLVVETSFHIVS